MRRVVAILLGVLILVLGSGNITHAQEYTDPGEAFYSECSPAPRCKAGKLAVASSVNSEGTIGLSFEWKASKSKSGKALPVNITPPSGWTCKYVSRGVIYPWGPYERITQATYVACYWSVLEELPGTL